MESKMSSGIAYRKLRTNIEFNKKNSNVNSICLTSANKGSGTTTVACNLANTFVANKKRVLLIDCNINHPQIHKVFNMNNDIGLTECLENKDYKNYVKYAYGFKDSNSDNLLYVMSAGKKRKYPIDLLSSNSFREFIESMKLVFDFILIDCPSLQQGSDVIPVSHVVDGTVLVVSLSETDKNIAKKSIDQLKRNGVTILGTVLNKVE